MITIYQITASKVLSVYHICSEKVCDLLCTSSTHFEVKSKSRLRVVVVLCFISFDYIYNIWKKLKVMRKLVKLKAKWRSLEMHQNDGVWVVLSLSQSPLLSLTLARAPCSICGCRKCFYTPRCGGHISILPLFPLPLAKFLYQTRFGRGRMGAGACEIPAAGSSPAPGSSSSSASLLLYGRPHCGSVAVGGPRCTFAASRFHSHLVYCRPTTDLLNYEIMFSRESTVTSTSASTKKMTTKLQKSEQGFRPSIIRLTVTHYLLSTSVL